MLYLTKTKIFFSHQNCLVYITNKHALRSAAAAAIHPQSGEVMAGVPRAGFGVGQGGAGWHERATVIRVIGPMTRMLCSIN